jgi:hypothetical protein
MSFSQSALFLMTFQNLLAAITVFAVTSAPLVTHASGVSIPAKGVKPRYCPAPLKNSHVLRDLIQGGQGGKVSFELDAITLTINVKPKYQLYRAFWVGQIEGKKFKIYHCANAMGTKITAAEYALVKWTLIDTIPLSDLD